VAELQSRLARAGYYHGAIDGIMGPATRRAIRAYERDHNMGAYGAIDQGLLSEDRNRS
jgi:peptidoglycan hydrolase-like protein with peptidoglycan-binding domain